LLTHSQSGPYGWHIADARPELVKAILAIEPSGPPFIFVQQIGPPEYLRSTDVLGTYGITYTPVTYNPIVVDPMIDLKITLDSVPIDTSLTRCYLQQEPARKLANLTKVPVLVVTGEASSHASYDHGTVSYLRQAGVNAVHLSLAERGICGNGHMMMLEKNNMEIAQTLFRWLQERGVASAMRSERVMKRIRSLWLFGPLATRGG
jgi:pimeloyl-ACP methyl ester carboxylesterase